MVEFGIGFSVKFEKKKKPFMNGVLFANSDGDLEIELHDPKHAHEFIAGLIPNARRGEQEEEEQQQQQTSKDAMGCNHGIG